jgi:hypothetical protein
MSRISLPIVYVAFGIALLLAISPALKVLLFSVDPSLEQLLLIRCTGF